MNDNRQSDGHDKDNVSAGNSASAFPAGEAITIRSPERQTVPVVFASPHSGREYPEAFLALSRLDPLTLRRSEDAYVEELFAGVTDLGAPLISARFPRVFVDVNREPDELDPAMFTGSLPPDANTRSPRVAAGLGTIARVVSDGHEIYDGRIAYSEAAQRIEECYIPYHRALSGLVDNTMRRFGTCLVVDCHSMPSRGNNPGLGQSRIQLVLGDCWGSSCDRAITETAERAAREQGLTVQRNTPYAGGFTTRHYGKPMQGIHTLQLEIDRGLYMDEATLERLQTFDNIRRNITMIASALTDMGWERLAAE